ncbi:MAG TPA: hypothetical protein ENJ53_10830 [Phaeodactylibacter sp.]|nr:hypothetical protein [Phaeodactylibacter sp.]
MIDKEGGVIFFLGIYFGFLLIPVGGLFNSKPKTAARKKLSYYVLGLALVGLIGAVTCASWVLYIFFIGIFIFSFAANYIIMKSAKEFG